MKSVLIHRVYTDSRSHVLLQRRWDIIETDRSAGSDSCWRSEVRPGPHTVDIILCPLLADWIQRTNVVWIVSLGLTDDSV